MDPDDDLEGTNESGGSLRKNLEKALSDNASLAKELSSYKASAVIAEKGYKFVTPEDLAGVDLANIAAKAEEVEKAKGTQAESLLSSALKAKFGDDLDVEAFLGTLATGKPESESTSLHKLGKIQGQVPGSNKFEGLHGRDLIKAAVKV